ncbi:Alpha/Beta hydrolase protein [Globomyces pollinis-pini]|nr:Alpha/Beta hydrolase protein [Globomyces pollinis-pini]
MIQRTTVIPTAIPRRGKLILDPFRVEQEVIDFIHKQEPGEWPPHASDMYEVHAEWVIPPSIDEDYVFYLIHGGAYILGSAQMERNFAYRYGKHSRCKVFAVSYRLAPQNPYPCGLIDVVSGYLHLLAKYEANKIVLMGDSAGGGLVLATLLLLRDMGKPLPAGGLDLTQSRPSLITNAFSDYIPDMPKDSRLGDRVNYYAPNHLLKVPYVSPYWADDLSNLPPLLIQTGNAEKLHDEICEFSHNLSKIPNAYITLESYHAHVHVFQMLYFNKGAKVAVKRMAQWIKQITGREASAQTESRHFKLDHHGNILITQDFADITQ